MATYTLNYTNNGAPSEGSFSIEVADNLIRQYSSIVNAGIGEVLAKACILLILAENGELTPEQLLQKGLDLEVE